MHKVEMTLRVRKIVKQQLLEVETLCGKWAKGSKAVLQNK